MSPMPSPGPVRIEPVRIEVCKNEDHLAACAASRFVELAGRALGARGMFHVALAGGQTPQAAYALLHQEHMAWQVVWPAVQIYFSDERCVAADHPDSNYRMAHETLLSRVPLKEANVHRMRGEEDPARAAEEYERDLRAQFGSMPVRLDLVMLGMGADGHTASLFPGGPPGGESGPLVADAVAPDGGRRITLTLPAINAARTVMVIVSGAGKAAMLKRVLGAGALAEGLPIQQVKPADGQLLWVIDQAAASELDGPSSS